MLLHNKMELKQYSNTDLYALRTLAMNERDERMIRRVVHQVHSFVVSYAKEGKREYKWNCDTYPFDNFQDYDIRHIVDACVRLQELFPEATITRPRPKEILVQWY